jgi:glycine/D-amino acid oxidase-like deaminating enzyme
MAEAGVEVRRACAVAGLAEDPGGVRVALENGAELRADRVFNCTYANLNHLSGARAAPAPLKYEITEVCLVDVPDELKNLGITVMDGPFFSVMPFPAKKLHSLTHVRYTPHAAWRGAPAPDEALADYPRISRFPYMLRDAARYLPAVAQSRLRESLFEVKTVLLANETDDGRPILFDKSGKRIFSVLGGKMDNIYDILEAIERELPCPN